MAEPPCLGSDTEFLHEAASASEEVQYNQRIEVLQKLTNVRLSLRGNRGPAEPYRDSLSKRLKSASCLLLDKWTELVGSKKGEEFNFEAFSSIVDFTECCKAVITELLHINTAHDGKLVQAQRILETKRQLLAKEVLLSFYGQFNAGKSTILNSILQNKFLPKSPEPETSLTLCISPTLEGEVFMNAAMRVNDGWNMVISDDVKQNCLIEDGVFVANGVADIYKYLKDKNRRRRNVTTIDTEDCFYVLKAKMPLVLDIPTDWRLCLMDNPGFDEYGSNMTEVAFRGLGISSACLYVTTFCMYPQIQNAEFFQSMYQNNKDIFKQKRLIVIVNKVDEVCCKSRISHDSDDEELSVSDMVSKVHAFVVQACHCSEEDVPRDVIIPLYGLWAYKARMLLRQPESVEGRKVVVGILLAMNDQPSGQGESPESRYAGKSSCELAQQLQHLTNIFLLESRLQDMAKGSVLVWLQKISHDLSLYLQGSKQKLNDKLETLKGNNEVVEESVSHRLAVLTETYEMYRSIMETISKTSPLWQKFKQSFEEDMETGDLRSKTLKTVKDMLNLESFKDSFTSKIKSGKVYGPKEFEEDLQILVLGMSSILHETINSRISFSRMLHVCSEQFRILTAEVARVGTRVDSLSKNSGGYTSMMRKKVKDVVPLLSAPSFEKALAFQPPNVCASLQERLLLICQKTIQGMRNKFLSISIKDYIADFDPGDQYPSYFIEDVGFYQPSQISWIKSVQSETTIDHDESSAEEPFTIISVVTSQESGAAQPILEEPQTSLPKSGVAHPIVVEPQPLPESGAALTIVVEPQASLQESGAAQTIVVEPQPLPESGAALTIVVEPQPLQESGAALTIVVEPQASLLESSTIQRDLIEPQTIPQQAPEEIPTLLTAPPVMTPKMYGAVIEPNLIEPANPSIRTKKDSQEELQEELKGVRGNGETPSKSSSRRNYKKWTAEVEKVFILFQTSIESEIEAYFDDFDDDVVKKYCESYTESAMMSLRNFDDAFNDQLLREISLLKRDIDKLLVETEKQKKFSYQCSLLGYLLTQFMFVSTRHQQN